MNRTHIIPIVLLVALAACSKEPESPTPDPIKSYFVIYNFLAEPYDVAWEIEEELVETVHTYGTSILEFSIMESEVKDVSFTAKEAGGDRIIESVIHQAEQLVYYAVSILGNESDPQILIEPMELEKPSPGQVKLRFMHTAMELGPLDLYIGGSTPDHKALSNIQFAKLTEYIEASQENLWEAVFVTLFNVAPEDSILLQYTANNVFIPNRVYMGVLGHTTSSTSSSLHLQLFDQPSY
jgi:hypothetical protein